MEIFIKELTANDVERKLSVPEGCLHALPWSEACQGTVLLQVKDDVGILWNFRCMKRLGAVERLVIVSGWIQFVQSKELHCGDVVIFYREDDIVSGAHYKIEVQRNNLLSSVQKNKI
ncbi:hypothetical protein PTKIN_Ptkin02bG0187200 [Pterospermum kingtungense]